MSTLSHESLAAADPTGRLFNADLAPAAERHWTSYNYFAMWMSAIHNIGTYTFVAGMFAIGLTGWQVLCSLAVGITILYGGMVWAGRRSPFSCRQRW